MTASPSQPATAPTPPGAPRAAATDEPSIGQLVATASESLSTLVRSEIELAKLELTASVKNAGIGAGLFGAALVVLVFSLTFGFIALAEGIIALGLSRWLGYLIVFGALVLVAALAVLIGIRKVKRIKAPEKTISTTKQTVDYLKSHPTSNG